VSPFFMPQKISGAFWGHGWFCSGIVRWFGDE
jgi:hypothetical protein